MKPLEDGTYLAQGKFFPLLALATAKSTKEQCPEGGPSRHSLSLSCAGALVDEYTREILGETVVLHLPPPEDRRKNPELWKRRGSALGRR